VTTEELIKKWRDAMEAARKKLSSGAGAEKDFAEAYRQLCKIDPTCRPNRKRYRYWRPSTCSAAPTVTPRSSSPSRRLRPDAASATSRSSVTGRPAPRTST
jgi:hypothetical protein